MEMDPIWQRLPYELTGLILEFYCVQNIRQRLVDTNNEFLLEELPKHNAKIAGSFILQCALDETYDDYDIDIYHSTKNDMEEVLDERLCRNRNASRRGYRLDYVKEIKYTIEYNFLHAPLPSVEAIAVKMLPEQFIDNVFDSDLCSIWFDGRRLSPRFQILYHRLLHKQMQIDISHDESVDILKMGMSEFVRTERWSWTQESRKLEKSCERAKKYRQRGFNVKINPILA